MHQNRFLYISGVIDEIKSCLPNGSKTKFKIGFVCYRDFTKPKKMDKNYNPDLKLYDIYPKNKSFKSDIEKFKEKLGQIKCGNGVDWAEDVLGGLKKAISFKWSGENRIIYHYLDAPNHGHIFHDEQDLDVYFKKGRKIKNITRYTQYCSVSIQLIILFLEYVKYDLNPIVSKKHI